MNSTSNIAIGNNFPMRVRIALDGEEVYNKEAHSFLRNYILFMRSFMDGIEIGQEIASVHVTDTSSEPFDNSLLRVTAVSIISGKLRLTTASSHSMVTGQLAYVMGVNTITGGTYLGYQTITVISTTVIELTNTSGLSGTHSDAISIPYIRRGKLFESTKRADSTTFGEPRIAIGTGTSANTVTTEQMAHEIPTAAGLNGVRTMAVSAQVATIDEPSVGATTSIIEIEQVFTNNSGASIGVNEIGIWTHIQAHSDSGSRFALMIRDVLGSTVTVNNGQTLTVTYELTTDVPTTDGGILIQFNEIFYRQLAVLTRESKDIFNQNAVKGQSAGQFYANSKGGLNPLSHTQLTATSLSSYYVGPRAGSSTEPVVNTNFRLQDSIAANTAFEHGDDANELYHYGSVISPIQDSGSDLFFTITRIFENRTVSTITINEVGLYVGFLSSNNIENVHCIARHLITPIALTIGEYFKLTYEFRITV